MPTTSTIAKGGRCPPYSASLLPPVKKSRARATLRRARREIVFRRWGLRADDNRPKAGETLGRVGKLLSLFLFCFRLDDGRIFAQPFEQLVHPLLHFVKPIAKPTVFEPTTSQAVEVGHVKIHAHW